MRVVVRRSWTLPSLACAAALAVVAGGAAAAVETDTVTSFGKGLWWSISLLTTVGFVGSPPSTPLGALLSVLLMVSGFFLIAIVSAAMASLFVRDDERNFEAGEQAAMASLLAEVRALRAEVALLSAGHPGGVRARPAAGSPTRPR